MNMNDEVTFKFTQKGKEVWDKYYRDQINRLNATYPEKFNYRTPAGDEGTEMLWVLFEVFGSEAHPGGNVCVTDIEVMK
jgi:hypothetical protein